MTEGYYLYSDDLIQEGEGRCYLCWQVWPDEWLHYQQIDNQGEWRWVCKNCKEVREWMS